MSLKIGIVGLPNVGKSTLFNALTKKSVNAENYPFCTIDPSVGVVPVPDERLWKLSEFSSSKETIPAVVEFVDIAGLVKGAALGEGLGNAFLTNIREVDAIAHVVRIFDDPNVHHVTGTINPKDDIETIDLELILADLDVVNRRLMTLEREVRGSVAKAKKEQEILLKVKGELENDKLARDIDLSREEKGQIKHLNLLTMKLVLFVLNKQSDGSNLDETDPLAYEQLTSAIKEMGAEHVLMDAQIENEVKELEGEEKAEFRRELGSQDSGFDDFIARSYELLGLQTFFTTGEKETRAWTTKVGATAPEAGAAIHSDFQDKFIRAEVIHWDELLEAGSRAAARKKGIIRIEGKEYVVKDGDVVEFRI